MIYYHSINRIRVAKNSILAVTEPVPLKHIDTTYTVTLKILELNPLVHCIKLFFHSKSN